MRLFKKAVLAVAISGCLLSGIANALEFSATYSFGDSLSDSGAFKGEPDAGDGGKFTVDPGTVWVENLADYFGNESIANNPNNPDNTDPDGTNYAQGGAQVSSPIGIGQGTSPQAATPIRNQVDTYLGSNAQADRNALYTVWGGANDVFFNLGMVAGGLSADAALVNLATSASELIVEVERLADAGARYIMVPNLPDIGSTPSQVLQVVAGAGEGNPNQGAALIAAITVLATATGNPAEVQLQALAAAEAALGFPAGSLTPAFIQLSVLSTGLSSGFNAALVAGMNASDANIIPLDTFTMIGEIVADPGAFGLVNVTSVACATPSSLPCTPDTVIDPQAPAFFLFADGVHPTPAGHQIISDYALSVIAAPALVANLPEVALGSIRGHQQMIHNQTRMGQFSDGWNLFADIAVGYQNLSVGQAWDADSEDIHLMFGGAKRLSDHLALGAVIEKNNSVVDFARDMGSFDLDSFSLSLFANYRNDRLFADAIVTLGLQTDFDDVTRNIKLGGGYREEKGDTEADLFAIKGLLGYDLLKTGDLTAGPFASINYQSVDVDAYTENGQRATSMNFADQDRDSLLAEVGVFADYQISGTTIHGGLSYEAELKDDARTVSAGLNSIAGSQFNLYDITPSGDAWKLDLGLSAKLADNLHAGIAYAFRSGEDDNEDHLINVGFRLDL